MAKREDNPLIKERIKKLNDLREKGINPYAYSYKRKHHASELKEKYSKLEKEETTKDEVSIAGRIMQFRKMGKASFMHVQDQTGRTQVYLRQDDIGKENYDLLKLLDLGDIVGVVGTIFATKTGEVTVYASKIEILTKGLRPLPEKWHGLQDKEDRYRKRYLDLIMNPEVRELFEKKAIIIDTIRNYLKELGYLEVETPALGTIYGGASAEPFVTKLNALNMEMFMSISPELFLKRLIVGGYEKVFTICKNFRNEGIDRQHNPEFTALEFYQTYGNYELLMNMTEELMKRLITNVLNGESKINYAGKEIDLKPPYKRIKFRDLILEETGIDIDKTNNFKTLKAEIENKKIDGVDVSDATHYGALLDELYKRVVRPKLIQPVFLTHYPTEMIALAKRNEDDPTKINSFQLVIDGAELIKAYDELNDPIDQEERLAAQQELLASGDDEAMPMDEDFVESLEYGMPPTAGYGLGIDRLVMFLTGAESIRDVILFPFMKPLPSLAEDQKEIKEGIEKRHEKGSKQ